MMVRMQCPFCDINSQKERIIETRKHSVVFLSSPRLMPGHLLVIPKRHVDRISQLTPSEREEVFDVLAEFEEKILARFSAGCDIRTHYKPFLKEDWTKVNHLHFHLHPRELRDELYTKVQVHDKELWKDLPDEERERFVKLYGN